VNMRVQFRHMAMVSVGVALLSVSALAQAATKTHAASKPRVLLLGPSVQNGTASWEAKKAKADGFAVTVVSAKQWDKMTTVQFKQYRALIIGDNHDSDVNLDVQAAVDNTFVWGHAINGNIILAGSDPEDHASGGVAGAKTYIAKAIAFAAKRPGRTGFYFAGNYYRDSSPQHVEVLDGLAYNGFYWQEDGGNTIHIDPAVTPKVPGLTDTIMSNWSTTSHAAFTKWPKSFHVWAVAVDSSGNWTTSDSVKGWATWLVSSR
jgi:hypothetical protein